MNDVSISLSPTFEWEYTSLRTYSDGEGNYRIEGLQPGTYNAEVNKHDPDGPYRRMNKTIEIAGDTAHDFIFREGHVVTARLVFPESMSPEERVKFKNANLQTTDMNMHFDQDNPEQISRYGSTKITNEEIEFKGRFRGEYIMALSYTKEDNKYSHIGIPGTYQLDNILADQDLGDITIPSMGNLRVNLVFEPEPTHKIENLTLLLLRDGDTKQPSVFGLQSGNSEQTIESIPAGTYDVVFAAITYNTEPRKSRITILPGSESTVSVVLRPTGMLGGVVQDKHNNRKQVKLAQITLTGPEGARLLVPTEGEEIDPMAIYLTKEDAIFMSTFFFFDLAGGTYEITIEADGYEPLTETREVIPGVFNPGAMTFQLTPLSGN